MNKFPQLATLSIALLSASQAAEVSWNGSADSEWLNPANWTSNPDLPVEGTGNSGDILRIDSVANPAIFDSMDGTRTYRSVRVGFNSDGRLDVTGGTLSGDHTIPAQIGRAGHRGTLLVSGTGNFRSGTIVQIGIDNGSTGLVGISGGSFTSFRGAVADGLTSETSIHLGAGGTGRGSLELSGGSLNTRFGMLIGNAAGTGSGEFRVTGGGWNAVIGGNNGLNPANSGFWLQRGNGTLAARVNSSDFSLGTLGIHQAGSSFLTFEGGSFLDLGFTDSAPTVQTSWDLMTFGNEAVLTDHGLALAPGNRSAGWSFAFVDTDSDTLPDKLRITFTPPPDNTPITVESIAGLKAAAGLSHHDVTMAPGTYWLNGPASKPSPHSDYAIFLDLSGTGSTFDFTGVTLLVDTRDLRGYGRAFGHGDTVRVFQISGDQITVEGLTLDVVNVAFNGTDTWGRVKEYTADWSTTLVEITGHGTLLKDSGFTTRGSYPYGFGDAFGKGGRPQDGSGSTNAAWIDHRKHSGIRLGRGVTGVTLDNVTLQMRTFGHGIFMQEGASDVTIRNCSVLGDTMAESNDIIAHPVYQQWGFATYRQPIPAGIRISKHEDGIRVYTNSNHAANGWPQFVKDVTVENSTVERMRDGLALGDMQGDVVVTDSMAWECEQGFTPSQLADSNTFTGCKGDARNGPLVFFRRSATNVTISCELAGNEPPLGDWPIALISGSGHDITLTRSSPPGTYPDTARVCVSQGWREWRHAPPANIDALGSGNASAATAHSTIRNLTGQPLVLGVHATNNTATSDGGVIHKGPGNTYTGTTLVPPLTEVTDTWGTHQFFAGVRTVDSPSSLGGPDVADAGTLGFPGSTIVLMPGVEISGEPLVLSGSGTTGQGALFSHGQPGTGTRWGVNDSSGADITLAGDTRIGVGTPVNQLLIGRVGGTGSLTKVGPGLLVLENGGNNFDGAFFVNEGSVFARSNKVPGDLIIAHGATFGQLASLALNQSQQNTTTIDGTFDLNGRGAADLNAHMAVAGRLLGSVAGVITSTSTSATQTLVVTSESLDSSFAGGIVGNVSLVKSGAATLALNGVCTHAAPTLVQAGTLEVNGSISAASNVTVASGARLAGSGTIHGEVVIENGATVSPGTGVGILTTGPQTWHGGGTLEIDMNDASGGIGSGWDLLALTFMLTTENDMTPGNPFRIVLNPVGEAITNFDNRAPYSWHIVSSGGTFPPDEAGSFAVDGSALTQSLDGGTFGFSASGGDLFLTFTPSPFAAWKLENHIPAAVSASEDPEGNGMTLLLEYSLGIKPGSQGNPIGLIATGPSSCILTFHRARAGIVYQVLVSHDLEVWQVLASDPGIPGSLASVDYTAPELELQTFMRLRVAFREP